ncbi:hypothetical protein FV228_00050 [Methylobacterium sp. WL18]|uniref:hypothetical protein n=1 Tax=Methylobacterium sp. WL18 TaxID=2603897 RepID=UPI0011CA9167|nr:hypothetical protein [Methylobacterium sp. WL18]TXN76581.1 hypothetical protein FV228_00050 [Methylobacterium sp. WL18]
MIEDGSDLSIKASVDPDLRAAEYVLGSLDAWDRAEVARQATTDARMADRIRVWERWLAPLLDAIPPVVPRSNLHAALLKALFERSE